MSMSSDGDPIVRTQGLTSQVWSEDDPETVEGHVLLLDLDGCDELTARRTLDELTGVRALLESSPGSYHIWSLGVETQLREQVLRALSIFPADDRHAGASLRRGYAVLRLGRKRRSTGETYKDSPTLRRVRVEQGERPQSRPHYAMLRLLAEEDPDRDPLPDPAAVGAEWIGDDSVLRVDHYETLTDSAKGST